MFLYKFIQSPTSIGSVVPSSRFLVEAMVRHVDWRSVRTVVELGAGTGVITQYIQKLKHSECRAIIFESDPQLLKRLQKSYPTLCYSSNAEDIYPIIKNLGLHPVDCVISSLPFANFNQDSRDKIMDGVEALLKPGGRFVAFQYSLQMRKQLAERFEQVDVDFVPFNLPPAFVYQCIKGEGSRLDF